MIPLFKVSMSGNASLDVSRVLNSGHIGQGPVADEFEERLAQSIGNPNVVTVNSCTSGLQLALYMPRFPLNTKMLTTALTCTATTWSGRTNHLIPEWCDIDPRTLNICLQDVRRKMNKNTRVLMLVHWGGYPIDMDEVAHIKQEYKRTYGYGLYVVEDCAHAWGATYKGKKLGNHGNVAVYSFGPIKTLTCGDGGAIVFPNESMAVRARKLRWYGIDRVDRDCDIPEAGFKYHMNDINASIGLANLKMSEYFAQVSRANMMYYDYHLKGVPGIKLLERKENHESSSWVYTMLVERRNDFIVKMINAGIEAKAIHKRNDQYSCMKIFEKELPRLDSIYNNIICIPCGWWVKGETREHIVGAIRSGW